MEKRTKVILLVVVVLALVGWNRYECNQWNDDVDAAFRYGYVQGLTGTANWVELQAIDRKLESDQPLFCSQN